MEEKITVIFSSQKKGEENEEFIKHIKDSCGCESNVVCIYNPDGVSLSKIYADMVDSNEIKTNIIIFIHDDVEFLKERLGGGNTKAFQ